VDLENLIKKVVERKTKFIVVTGGVCSSIGKGVLTSSLGVLLKNAGYSISVMKWDPYLNVDPGTMSPLEHGEVFVTADGAETDLDLGHYERNLQIKLTRESSVSSGQVFKKILDDERAGLFLGKCIQLVPHVVCETKRRLLDFAVKNNSDFVLLEIGGTIGDMEGKAFLEAVRQLRLAFKKSNLMYHAHLSYVPFLAWTGEIKTKPTQHSVNALKKSGLVPDALFLRAVKEISPRTIKKLTLLCGVEHIFQVLTFNPIYNLFLDLERQKVGLKVQEYFGITMTRQSDLSEWKQLIDKIESISKKVKIGLVAKYVGINDPYISVIKAIQAAACHNDVNAELVVIDAEQLENDGYCVDSENWNKLKSVDGIVVPGGFDKRGSEGKIFAVRWARENNIPYLGLCLGMQVMLIEIARSLVGLKNATSTEFSKDSDTPVISLLKDQENLEIKGGSMRLGEFQCDLVSGTKAHDAYSVNVAFERHRHRYEFNNKYRDEFQKAGVVFSGIYKEKDLVEIAELKDHSFMVGSQFHPEFTSYPLKPNPLFVAFIKAIVKK
jgi:CTP synthase